MMTIQELTDGLDAIGRGGAEHNIQPAVSSPHNRREGLGSVPCGCGWWSTIINLPSMGDKACIGYFHSSCNYYCICWMIYAECILL